MANDYPELNRQLLERIVNWALAPEQSRAWDQMSYLDAAPTPVEVDTPSGRHVCGTTACIAGWAVLDQASDAQLVSVDYEGIAEVLLVSTNVDAAGKSYSQLRTFSIDVESRARELLGLTQDEADALFDPDNDENDVRRITDAILAGEYR